MTDLDELRALSDAATPGPWAWFDDNRAASPYLATVNQGRIYVMGFARRGMNAAQPLWQVRDGPPGSGSGVMRTAAEIGPDWPKHPDAAFIVAAVNHVRTLLAPSPAECAHIDAYGSTIIIGENPAMAPVCIVCDRRFPRWPMLDVIEGETGR